MIPRLRDASVRWPASCHTGIASGVLSAIRPRRLVPICHTLAHMAVPRFDDLAIVDLLEAVLSGDEPNPGPLTGTVALRRAAHQSIFEGVPEAVVKPGDVDVHPEFFPSARCLATGKAILTGVNDLTFMSATGHNSTRAATIRKFGLHAVLSVPIRARGVTLGVAVFVRGQRPEPFEQGGHAAHRLGSRRCGVHHRTHRQRTRHQRDPAR